MGLFNSTVLDVAIGLVFVYLLLAILCTAANEWLAAVTKTRAKFLEKGLRELLNNQPLVNGGDPDEFINQFYNHPLITGMMRDRKHPAYLSARTFAAAVSDLIAANFAKDAGAAPDNVGESTASVGETSKQAVADLERGAAAMPEGDVQKAVSALVKLSKRELLTNQEALERWFNDAMDRVTGWYKRRTQFWTLIVAILITLLANASTIGIARKLWTDPVLRTAVVEEAKVRATKPPPPSVTVDYPDPDDPSAPQVTTNKDEGKVLSDKELDLLGQMLGWHENPFWDKKLNRWHWDWTDWLERLIGWLLTVLALSLGAPFWFDVLNKFINIRSAGKSPDEKAKVPEKANPANA
jgi:hypothetical protein